MVSSLDPLSIPEGLWRHDDVRSALDRRDIASLFRLVRQHTGASQTRIGIATGLSQGTVCLIMKGSRLVTAIDVLERIADGLAMPDEARVRLGLAPRASTLCSVPRDSAAETTECTRPTVNFSVGAGTLDHERRKREAALAEAYAAAQAQRATATLTIPCPDPAQHVNGRVVPSGQDALTSVVTTVGAAAGAALAEGLAGPFVYLLSGAAQSVSAEWGDQLHEQLGQFLDEWANTMERRELLRLLGWTAVTVVASPVIGSLDSDEQERVVGALAEPSRVDAQVIEHIEAVLRHCKRQDDVLGPRAVLHTVLAQCDVVRGLLKDCPTALRSRLLSVYSSMSSSAGTYCFDLDDAASATRYYDQARAVAQEAHNIDLAIYALCEMSYFASWQGKVHAGIDFAAAAQSLAGKTDDVLLQVCAAERAATAYAIDGQYKECMAEFDRASTGLALPISQRPPESPVYYFNEEVVASRQSDCLLRLGKPVEAVASAERGLQLFDNSFTHGLAYCTLRLGTARLLSGEVEEATRVIGEGALLAARIRSTRLTGEVRAARGRLEPWKDTQAVKVLDERLASYGARPGSL